MKSICLKPVVWNDQGYKVPAGCRVTSGFAKKHGYGHEEWNNSDDNIWHGFRVFHTQTSQGLDSFAKQGELGLILTASHKGGQYALGIATSVWGNSKDDMKLISLELGFEKRLDQLWEVESVRRVFSSKRELSTHWSKNCYWQQWKCPKEEFTWFESPLKLNPKKLTGKQKIIERHGSFQTVSPEIALKIVLGELGENHPSVLWLTTDEFDESMSKSVKPRSGEKLRKRYGIANAPANHAYEYWVQGKRSVNPHHATLQSKYVQFLRKDGASAIVQDDDFIDVQYLDEDGCLYIVEVKPTNTVSTKYAIRNAIGQLLEYAYKYTQSTDPRLEIVLGSKPSRDEIAFLHSLNISVTYLDGRRRFVQKWTPLHCLVD